MEEWAVDLVADMDRKIASQTCRIEELEAETAELRRQVAIKEQNEGTSEGEVDEDEDEDEEEEEESASSSDDLSYDENDDDLEIRALRHLAVAESIPTNALYRMWNFQGGVCFLTGVPILDGGCPWYGPTLVPYVVEKPLGRKNFRIVTKVAERLRSDGMRWSQLRALCALVQKNATRGCEEED